MVPEETETVSSAKVLLGALTEPARRVIDPERKGAGQDPHAPERLRQCPSPLLAAQEAPFRGRLVNGAAGSTPALCTAPRGPRTAPRPSSSSPMSGRGFFYYNNSEVVYFQNKDTQMVPSPNVLGPLLCQAPSCCPQPRRAESDSGFRPLCENSVTTWLEGELSLLSRDGLIRATSSHSPLATEWPGFLQGITAPSMSP